MTGLILPITSLVLLLRQPFDVQCGAAAEPPLGDHTWCHSSGACYSVHLASVTFSQAQEACAMAGGALSTASTKVEVQAIRTLLSGAAKESPGVFWLGLVRKSLQCTNEDLPLRGFSWIPAASQEETAANETTTTESPGWVKGPSKSCLTQKCAGLQVAAAGDGDPPLQPWGLRERSCGKASAGYVCKYRYAGVCPALHPPGARGLSYALPYRLQSAALQFSPPGTVLSLRCPTREVRLTCRLLSPPDGYRWEGAERGLSLCSCPSGYWSPSKGDCVQASDCLGGAQGQAAFLCVCALGFRLGADKKACLREDEDGATATSGIPNPAAPTTVGSDSFVSNLTSHGNSLAPLPSTVTNISMEDPLPYSASSSTYAFILITMGVVMLLILVLTSLQVGFKVCFKSCSSKGSQSNQDPEAVAPAPRPNSAGCPEPSKAELAETCQSQENPEPGDEKVNSHNWGCSMEAVD